MITFVYILNILLLAFPPVFFWGYFYYVKDKKEPEPIRLLVRSFLFGMVTALPLILIRFLFDWFPQFNVVVGLSTIITFVLLGFAEECIKLFTLMGLTRRKAIDVNQILDGAIYGVMVALGFAFIENIFYFAEFLRVAERGVELYGTYIFRGFITMFAHTIFTGIAGYFYILGKVEKKNLWIKGLVIAAVLHAIFNLFNVTSFWGFSLGYLNVLLLGGSLWYLLSLVKAKRSGTIRKI